jgi:putative oxygen-independent coproporphyrinogen III oxidase
MTALAINPANIPLALYVHFPWCVSKCPYCDFNSHPLPDVLPEAAYLEALLNDLGREAILAGGRRISSVFMGGGTPSLFSPAAMARLLTAVDQLIGLAADAEVTLEANPGAIEHGDFAAYRAAGINRLSLGVQSFDDAQLKQLGRVHDAAAAVAAFAKARRAGFDNINLDLMYALPEQTVTAALADLNAALELGPEHLSHYHLTMEPGTRFGKRPPAHLPDDETSWQMLEACQARLAEAGFARYEISAYARPGRRCAHNLNYWRYGDYLGIGAGAHAKVSLAAGGVLRYAKHAKPARFQSGVAADADRNDSLAMSAQIDPANAEFEFMLNNLRLLDGFSTTEFTARTGSDIRRIQKALDQAVSKGLLVMEPEGLGRPTELGIRFLDDLQALFLP